MHRAKRKYRIGTVVGEKCSKTRQVFTERVYAHSLYGVVVRSRGKIAVHDNCDISHNGDIVKIMEARPMSKTKKWVIVEVIKKARVKLS
ncbi:MAG: 30S ribosomal protein S17 [Elusimicrobiota bacterium]|nr:30S ribosomal protein S17 [Elusimicrobiota bacterium]